MRVMLCQENGQQSRIGINSKKRRYAEKEIKQATSGEELMSMIEDAVDPILVQVRWLYLFFISCVTLYALVQMHYISCASLLF